MTKEEKQQLLLKDLSARWQYGVKIKDLSSQADTIIDVLGIKGHFVLVDEYNRFGNIYDSISIEYVKPYLRSMSNMTKEEEEELRLLKNQLVDCDENNEIKFYSIIDEIHKLYLSHHIDFMGLIPKGLAIEATQNIYN